MLWRRRPGRVPVLPQGPQDGTQRQQRLVAHLFDRGQRPHRPLVRAVQLEQRCRRLDIDQGDVLSQDIMKLPGDAKPFLAHLAAGLLPAQPRGLGSPEASQPQPFRSSQQDEQPGGSREGQNEPRGIARAQQRREPLGQHVVSKQNGHSGSPVTRHHHGHEGHDQAEPFRPGHIAQRLVHGSRRERHRVHLDRPPPPYDKGERRRHQQNQPQGVDLTGVGFMCPGNMGGANNLDDADGQRENDVRP